MPTQREIQLVVQILSAYRRNMAYVIMNLNNGPEVTVFFWK